MCLTFVKAAECINVPAETLRKKRSTLIEDLISHSKDVGAKNFSPLLLKHFISSVPNMPDPPVRTTFLIPFYILAPSQGLSIS